MSEACRASDRQLVGRCAEFIEYFGPSKTVGAVSVLLNRRLSKAQSQRRWRSCWEGFSWTHGRWILVCLRLLSKARGC